MIDTLSKKTAGFKFNFPFLSRDFLEPFFVVVTLTALITSLMAERMEAPENLILLLNMISYFAGGFYAVQAGFTSLLKGIIDVDMLMIIAAAGAALVDSWHEGAILLFLFSLSNVLQAYAIGRSRNAIKSLLDLRPEAANLRRNGQIITVSIDDLKRGDVIMIRPGERIPADGKVINGSSAVNQATITGESMPVQKNSGDPVFAGTVNQNGTLDVEVKKLASESTLARIITMVEEAQDRHSTTQRRLDRFEQTYAKLIISATAFMILIPPLIFGADFDANFYRSMVLLVVASPCALVISTPASILSAIANAARHGILFKGGAHLEDMASLKAVAFDKTGTITIGEPRVTDVIPAEGISEEKMMSVLASAECHSEHPIAQAIVAYAQEKGWTITEPDHFEAMPGRGLTAMLKGQTVLVGTEQLMVQHNLNVPENLRAHQIELENGGKTTLLIYADEWLGVIAVADQVRPEAAEAVRQLRAAGIEHIVMLTGDNERIAARIAQEIGLTEYHAGLMPDEKVAWLEKLSAQYGAVGMVGDGVNDAPALAIAQTGIAMGAAGTDVALETADVVLMANDLRKIAYAVKLSKKSRRIVKQNLTISIGVIITLITLTLMPFLHVPLPLGVVGHEGSTLVVVSNGLRLLVWRGR